MRFLHAAVLFIIGQCFVLVGGLYKVMSWKGADMLLVLATIFNVLAGIILIYKLLTHPKVKDLFDKS